MNTSTTVQTKKNKSLYVIPLVALLVVLTVVALLASITRVIPVSGKGDVFMLKPNQIRMGILYIEDGASATLQKGSHWIGPIISKEGSLTVEDEVSITGPVLPGDVAPPGSFWKNRVDLAGPESLAWQARIAAVVTEEEEGLGARHLVAQNYCNHRYPVRDLDPVVDILNIHYAWPEAATLNAGLRRVVSFDETGFASPSDRVAAPETDDVYRRQAWEFLMAGGGVFSMLDSSFAVGQQDGTVVNRAPGGGRPALRRQLRFLKDFLHSFDIPDLKPRPGHVLTSPGAFTRAIGTEKRRGVCRCATRLRHAPPENCRFCRTDPAGLRAGPHLT